MKDSQILSKGFSTAAVKLESFIANGINEGEQEYVNLLIRTIKNYASIKNGEVNKDTLRFSIDKSVAVDQTELKQLVKNTLPEYLGE